jgi:ABC-type multidrug transport system fused ATPase/permease subunit
MLDGVDLTRINQHTLRRQLGAVLQEPTLFTGTIAQNIAMCMGDFVSGHFVYSKCSEAIHMLNGVFPFTQLEPNIQDYKDGESSKVSGLQVQQLKFRPTQILTCIRPTQILTCTCHSAYLDPNHHHMSVGS